MDFVLKSGKKPNTVYQLMVENNATESAFYKHFSSIDKLEKEIYVEFFNQTIKMIEKSEDFEAFETSDKLLTFYYTLFELFTANRSYVQWSMQPEHAIQNFSILKEFRKHFLVFVRSLSIEGFKIFDKTKMVEFKNKSIEEVAWMQFLMIFKFYLGDDSVKFEKTDQFIEKTVHAGFEVIGASPFERLIDWGKFVVKEKVSL